MKRLHIHLLDVVGSFLHFCEQSSELPSECLFQAAISVNDWGQS